LSYTCLTGVEARAKLRALRQTDPEFWEELINYSREENLPPQNKPQPEDEPQQDGIDDDSDVPLQVICDEVVKGQAVEGYIVHERGGLEANMVAEMFEDGEEVQEAALTTEEGSSQEHASLGMRRGKRSRRPNANYNSALFWTHNDESDVENDLH
jgi:hypothetical protein